MSVQNSENMQIVENIEEIKELAFRKIANITIYQISLIIDSIDLATSRGAFKGEDMSRIGALYDSLCLGRDKAFDRAREELKIETIVPVTFISDEKIFDPVGKIL